MLRTKLLIFKVGSTKYACNITSVDRIIKYENLSYVPSKQFTFEGVYNHEGVVIKIFNLSKILGVDNLKDSTHKKIIIAKNNSILVGLVVDEVLEVFNYNLEDSSNLSNEDRDLKLDKNVVRDMILIGDEIVRYLNIGEIVDMELGKSEL